MSGKHQNFQITPYPSEIIVSIYLVLTGFLILIFHSRLSEIQSHLTIRIILLLLLFTLSLRKLDQWQFLHHIRSFFPFVLLAYLYNETDYLNNLIINKDLDAYISQIENAIFSGQPALIFSQLIPYSWFAEFMYFGYFSYYLLIIGIPLYLYIAKDKETGLRVIFIIICSFLLYYSFFIIFPVAGPQFYYSSILHPLPEGYIFGDAIRIIQLLGEAPTAAFPSSHVSICALLLWLCFIYEKKLLIMSIPVAILLLFSTVYLRAHYVIDVFAGLLFTPIVFKISVNLCIKINNAYFSPTRIKSEL
jgi:membrane-associated phospholipid phosphatase